MIGVVQKQKDDKKKKKDVRVVLDDQDEIYDLFDIMQDNSCQIDLKRNYSIQKPKQVVGFNPKGKLAQGQGAA